MSLRNCSPAKTSPRARPSSTTTTSSDCPNGGVSRRIAINEGACLHRCALLQAFLEGCRDSFRFHAIGVAIADPNDIVLVGPLHLPLCGVHLVEADGEDRSRLEELRAYEENRRSVDGL